MLGRAERRFPNSRALEEAAEGLDVDFYRSAYPDLSELTDAQARFHYAMHGRTEGRSSSPAIYIANVEHEPRKLPDDFDATEYLSLNRDLHVFEQSWEFAVHYLKHGRWEGRKYKRRMDPTIYDLDILHRITLNVHDMPEVVLDSDRLPTVNVLVPAFDFGSMSAGFFGVFQVALLIKRCGLPVRLVMYDDFDFDEANSRENLKNYPGLENLFHDMEVEYVGDRKRPLRISSDDNCVATVWYSAYFARKIMSLRGGGKFLYLIQDYESGFYPNSTFFALAEATYSFDYSALFSTRALNDFFLKSKIGVFGLQGTDYLYFNNACSSALQPQEEFVASRRSDQPRRLAFYSRPAVHRNMFELGALALCSAYQQGVFASQKWEFIGIGLGQVTIRLAPGVELKQMERMHLREYQNVISTFDVGLCLMASSHPSLLPFDLSGSGAVVVTNSFGTKDQAYFDTVAEGVIVSTPDVPALVEALRAAVAASGDLAGRYAHAQVMKYPRSWDETFHDEHVQLIRKVFEGTFR
jgi:hypothetical protein